MTKTLTILVSTMEGVGHVNATIGIAEELKERGHRIVYVIHKSYEGILKKYGFEEELIEEEDSNMKPGESGATRLKAAGIFSNISSYEKMRMMISPETFDEMYFRRVKENERIGRIVEKVNPDIMLIDDFVGLPSLIHNGKPWVFIGSANPLLYIGKDERLPPPGSGYSSTDSNQSKWKEFRDLKFKWGLNIVARYNKWMTELGLPTIDPTHGMCIPHSPFLNIYGYPEELDYTDIRPIPDKWVRVDAFTRKGGEEFTLPEKFRDRDEMTQKLIYLSLGSMGSIDVELMKRLGNILAKSPHKFIVSKGILGDEYELADNMWGQNSVPQTKVLPLVDLVITHGGNNSVTETFSFGKPMIVLPLFGDQFDNAQRVHEKGFGIRIEPYDCTEEELLNAIEKLLNDKELKERLKAVVERMESEKSLTKCVEIIENLSKIF